MFSLILIKNCECSIQIIINETLNWKLIVNNWSSHKILVERLASSVLFANYFNIPSAKEEKKIIKIWSDQTNHPHFFSNRSRVCFTWISRKWSPNVWDMCVCRVQCDFSTLHPICLPNSVFWSYIWYKANYILYFSFKK